MLFDVIVATHRMPFLNFFKAVICSFVIGMAVSFGLPLVQDRTPETRRVLPARLKAGIVSGQADGS